MKLRDLTGQKFGRWTVMYRAVEKCGRRTYWHCVCDCGQEKDVMADNLTAGKSTSCGCITREKTSESNRTHGDSKSKLYGVWCNIKCRCLNKNSKQYSDYGKRGILLCDEWANSYEAFKKWSEDNGYREGLSIDRIDNNGNYEPNNCRWVDSVVQANNRRNNRIFTLNGETHTLTQWARIYNIDPKIVFDRVYRGIEFSKALLN